MMTKFVLAGAVLALMPFAASAQVTPQDYAFVSSVTHVDLTSVWEGNTALSDSSSPAVKNFAQSMVQAHTDEGRALAPISTGTPLPPSPTPCMTWQSHLLQLTKGEPFDPSYLQATIDNLTRLVAVMQGEIQSGTDANLKGFAEKELPAAQSQLAQAQLLMKGAPQVLPAPITVHPLFQSGEYTLSPTDQQGLTAFAHSLVGMQQVMVTATGYTDTVPIGAELKRSGIPTNEVLSEKRAESVKAYLTSQGVAAAEIQTRGMGPANPVASNATAAGRQQNRRVEVSVAGTAPAGTPMAMGTPSTVSCWE